MPAVRSGLAKIIEKVRISWYFETPEIHLHIAENVFCIEYTDSSSSKQVLWLSYSESPHHRTSNYWWVDKLQLYTGVARARVPIMGIHMRVACRSIIQWLPAILHNAGWTDNCKVCDGFIEAIPILDPLHVKVAYSHSASRHHIVQCNVLNIWMAWCELWLRRRLDGRKTCSLPSS
jgi:hypothetical protein